MRWVDTHCHLDAPELGPAVAGLRAHAAREGVVHCVIPAVEVSNFGVVRALAHAGGDSYCLGIHPLYIADATDSDLHTLDETLNRYREDPRLVAVGEIGLDFFVPDLTRSPLREKQERFYRAQLVLARKYQLPVVLHVRRSADRLLKHLREVGGGSGPGRHAWSGIAHAFNGSQEQARCFVDMGFKLGFGGAVTFERALQLRRLLQWVAQDAFVLETDAPDIPPQWLYATAQARSAGAISRPNTPAELPRIGAAIAQLRGVDVQTLAQSTEVNACQALPRLGALLV